MCSSSDIQQKLQDDLKIIGRVHDGAHMLELTPSMTFYDIFHVSLLRLYHKGRTPIPPPLPIHREGVCEYEVERAQRQEIMHP